MLETISRICAGIYLAYFVLWFMTPFGEWFEKRGYYLMRYEIKKWWRK